MRLAAARVASARSVPASRSAKPLNAAVPSSTSSGTTTMAAGLASGDQPSARATSRMMTAWSSSTPMTVAVLAAIRPGRDRGVAPSRLSTPYLRSNPVAIAWLVNAVDMTASAITPGVRKSIRVYPPPKSISGSRLNAASSSSGMTSVSVSCSPLRSSCLVSWAACAAIIRRMGAAPGTGVQVPAPVPAAAACPAMGWVVNPSGPFR